MAFKKGNKISIGNKWNIGRTPWNKGKKVGLGSSTSFKKGFTPWNKGMKGFLSGEQHYRWKGGISSLRDKIRHCHESSEWRRQVFMRDYYICQQCFNPNRGYYIVNAEHIKPFATILDENNVKTLEDAQRCKELWDINNGMTLCVPCHKKTDTYGYKYFKKLNSSIMI